jgi:aspartate racemase
VKTIGLIGGVSWYSSVEYYRIINETVADRLGGFHSAQCIMYSVDFAPIDALERQNLAGHAAYPPHRRPERRARRGTLW